MRTVVASARASGGHAIVLPAVFETRYSLHKRLLYPYQAPEVSEGLSFTGMAGCSSLIAFLKYTIWTIGWASDGTARA